MIRESVAGKLGAASTHMVMQPILGADFSIRRACSRVGGRSRGNMANIDSESEKRCWELVDQLWRNSKLKSSKVSVPVLGLIDLRYDDHEFPVTEKELVGHRFRP